MEIMMSAYGQETGNVGLKYLPYGGLYIAGGIAPKNTQYMLGEDSVFRQAFQNKGRVSGALLAVRALVYPCNVSYYERNLNLDLDAYPTPTISLAYSTPHTVTWRRTETSSRHHHRRCRCRSRSSTARI